MQYTLMHKSIPVLDIELDEATGSVQKLGTVHRIEHLPLGTVGRHGIVDRTALNTWWIDRCIPASRSGVQQALETLDIPTPQLLLTRCFGLSLSDQYWVRLRDSDLQWEEINFFDNSFSEDIGDVLLGKASKTTGFDFRSPDNTSDGFLKKRWKIIGGKRCLLKAGSNPFMQQPFNEVIATLVAERLEIPHVPYTLLWDDGVPYSVCEDFITPDTELVSAWRVMQSVKKQNDVSVHQHYLNCCEALGVSGIWHAVDQMIVLDYLIANEDRHQNNFGLIRDANTLEWLGAAPIFDSGSSFGYDKLPGQILSGQGVECKPFKKTHAEQLKLVSSFDWIDPDRLAGLEQEIRVVLDQAGEYMGETRKKAILSAYAARLKQLMKLSHLQVREDKLSEDVEQDTAQDYKLSRMDLM
ncbi:MAG: excisionase [Lachnospiraceae bacterium]|nr:excisionase [Lachnospiraceae bacterium]MCI8762958.1 excisionase [Oscillospiraceae bacterium]